MDETHFVEFQLQIPEDTEMTELLSAIDVL